MSLRTLIAHPRLLPRVLLADALLTGATALLLLAGGNALEPLLRLPAGLLHGAGFVLLPFVAFVFALSRQQVASHRAVAAVIAINVAWVVASVWLVVGGPFQPSVLGTAFVLMQAAVVAIFADLGYFGLRGARRASA